MNLEELERRAYTSGNLREVALLRAVIDLYNLDTADSEQDAVIKKLEFELRKTTLARATMWAHTNQRQGCRS